MVVVDVVKAVFVVIESRLRLRVAAVVRAPEDPAVDGRCLRMLSIVAFCPYLRRSAADTKGVISLFSPIGIMALGNMTRPQSETLPKKIVYLMRLKLKCSLIQNRSFG